MAVDENALFAQVGFGVQEKRCCLVARLPAAHDVRVVKPLNAQGHFRFRRPFCGGEGLPALDRGFGGYQYDVRVDAFVSKGGMSCVNTAPGLFAGFGWSSCTIRCDDAPRAKYGTERWQVGHWPFHVWIRRKDLLKSTRGGPLAVHLGLIC